MRVVQINAVYAFSSTGRTTKEMHESLQLKGIESYVFSSDISDKENHIFRIGNALDHQVHALFSRLFGLQGYFSRIPTRKLIRHLSIIKPDVVILRNLHANYIFVNGLLDYLGKNDIKTVVVLHDCWFYTGHCCYYTEDNCFKWEKCCVDCPILHKYNKSLFFDNSKKIFVDKKTRFTAIPRLTVVGVSKWVSEEAKKSPVFYNADVLYNYNWIDLEVFKPYEDDGIRGKLGIDKDAFVAISVSSVWEERKGLKKILSLAQMLKDVLFVLVGKLEDQILPPNVINVGPISSPKELAEYYSMGNVYLNFSIQETFGKVSAEALSCGLPVIAHNSTANPELVGQGCGYVVDTNNVDQIIDAINRVKGSDQSLFRKTCRTFAMKNFDKETIINRYIQLFTE